MPAGSFTLLLGRKHARWPAIATGILVIAGISAGIFLDLRWLLGAFFILLVAAPAFIALIYYSEALKPENFLNRLPHTISVEEDCIRVIIVAKEKNTSENNGDPDAKTKIAYAKADKDIRDQESEINKDGESFDWIEISSRTIPFDRWSEIRIFSNHILLTGEISSCGFLYIPIEAFPSEEDYTDAVRKIRGQIKNNHL